MSHTQRWHQCENPCPSVRMWWVGPGYWQRQDRYYILLLFLHRLMYWPSVNPLYIVLPVLRKPHICYPEKNLLPSPLSNKTSHVFFLVSNNCVECVLYVVCCTLLNKEFGDLRMEMLIISVENTLSLDVIYLLTDTQCWSCTESTSCVFHTTPVWSLDACLFWKNC